MEFKVKVTYFDYYNGGGVFAKIFKISSWYDLSSRISVFGILDSQILKVERVLTVSDEESEIID